jgi:hypothetical protein
MQRCDCWRRFRFRKCGEAPSLCLGGIEERSPRNVFHAATFSSLSAPRATITNASSGNGLCSAFRLIPLHAHPDIALVVGRQNHRHRLQMDRLDDRVRRCRQGVIDEMGRGIGFDFMSLSPLNSVQMPATKYRNSIVRAVLSPDEAGGALPKNFPPFNRLLTSDRGCQSTVLTRVCHV